MVEEDVLGRETGRERGTDVHRCVPEAAGMRQSDGRRDRAVDDGVETPTRRPRRGHGRRVLVHAATAGPPSSTTWRTSAPVAASAAATRAGSDASATIAPPAPPPVSFA